MNKLNRKIRAIIAREPTLAALFATPKAIVYSKCAECGQEWTTSDDPNEWQFGHDCESD